MIAFLSSPMNLQETSAYTKELTVKASGGASYPGHKGCAIVIITVCGLMSGGFCACCYLQGSIEGGGVGEGAVRVRVGCAVAVTVM